MEITLGEATKLLDNIMVNYSLFFANTQRMRIFALIEEELNIMGLQKLTKPCTHGGMEVN